MLLPRTMGTPAIVSVPALAAALRHTPGWHFGRSSARALHGQPLAALYQIGPLPLIEGTTGLLRYPAIPVEAEAMAAAHVIAQVAERLRRLSSAYAEWRIFDAQAFFDLYPGQAALLTHVSERVSHVHVVVYADLLLPSFQAAESYWVERFSPLYHAAHPAAVAAPSGRTSYAHDFHQQVEPEMIARWRRLLAVVAGARSLLSDDADFVATAGGEEERYRWQHYWQGAATQTLNPALLPPIGQIPTTTLTATFPLPAFRQPGRLRRLRRARQRTQRRHGPDQNGA